MRIVGLVALAASLLVFATSGVILAPSCIPGETLDVPRLSLGLDLVGGARLSYEPESLEGADSAKEIE